MNSRPPAIGWLVLLLRVALAGMFLFAAVMKLRGIPAFAMTIDAFKVIPPHAGHLTRFAAYFVPWLEIVAGLMLLLGVWTRAAAFTLTVVLAGFLVLVASTMIRGLDTSCSCFGEIDVLCKGSVGWCHVIRNAVLLALGIFVTVAGPGPLTFDATPSRQK